MEDGVHGRLEPAGSQRQVRNPIAMPNLLHQKPANLVPLTFNQAGHQSCIVTSIFSVSATCTRPIFIMCTCLINCIEFTVCSCTVVLQFISGIKSVDCNCSNFHSHDGTIKIYYCHFLRTTAHHSDDNLNPTVINSAQNTNTIVEYHQIIKIRLVNIQAHLQAATSTIQESG